MDQPNSGIPQQPMQAAEQMQVMQGASAVPPTPAPTPQVVIQDQPVAPAAPGAVPTPTAPVSPQSQIFTAEDIENARRQEKEKLYKELERYRSQVKELQEKVKSWEEERQAQLRAAEEEERKRREAEMDVRQLLQEKEREWEQRFKQLEAEREAEKAALEKEKEFARLQSYIQQRAREERDANRIAPELIDLINGNSIEEVERSIEMLREKTNAILQSVAAQVPQTPGRGVSSAGYTPTGPLDNQPTDYVLTPEKIRSMSMHEYAKIRPYIFGNNAQSGQGKGLFG